MFLLLVVVMVVVGGNGLAVAGCCGIVRGHGVENVRIPVVRGGVAEEHCRVWFFWVVSLGRGGG